MSYVVDPQLGVPHNDKKITKSEEVVLETFLTINDIFWKYTTLKREAEECVEKTNSIVDELVEIDKVHAVDDIPNKLSVTVETKNYNPGE